MLLAECAEMKLGGGGLAHRFTLTSIPGTFGLSSSAACSISRFTGLLNPRMIRASLGTSGSSSSGMPVVGDHTDSVTLDAASEITVVSCMVNGAVVSRFAVDAQLSSSKGTPSNEVRLELKLKVQSKSVGQLVSGSNLAMFVVTQRKRPGNLEQLRLNGIFPPYVSSFPKSAPRAMTGRENTTVRACWPSTGTVSLTAQFSSSTGLDTSGFNLRAGSRGAAAEAQTRHVRMRGTIASTLMIDTDIRPKEEKRGGRKLAPLALLSVGLDTGLLLPTTPNLKPVKHYGEAERVGTSLAMLVCNLASSHTKRTGKKTS
mmetsp:Transcript_23269/g.60648  ORF Transcript_23269/g.60648 Transcript_23269/m.60648 type:complete len:315 (+) Transcript_23269:2784-3728(+)